jgi:hypothetical protein
MDWSKDDQWKKLSRTNKKRYQLVLNKVNPSKLIKQLPDLHEEVFAQIDCLDCANCCKNHSPTFKATDIKRISKYLKIKETDRLEALKSELTKLGAEILVTNDSLHLKPNDLFENGNSHPLEGCPKDGVV